MASMDKETLGQGDQGKTHLVLQILETLGENQTREAVCTRWTQNMSYTSSRTQTVRTYRAAFETYKNALCTLYTLQKKTTESEKEKKGSNCSCWKKKMEPTTESEALS